LAICERTMVNLARPSSGRQSTDIERTLGPCEDAQTSRSRRHGNFIQAASWGRDAGGGASVDDSRHRWRHRHPSVEHESKQQRLSYLQPATCNPVATLEFLEPGCGENNGCGPAGGHGDWPRRTEIGLQAKTTPSQHVRVYSVLARSCTARLVAVRQAAHADRAPFGPFRGGKFLFSFACLPRPCKARVADVVDRCRRSCR